MHWSEILEPLTLVGVAVAWATLSTVLWRCSDGTSSTPWRNTITVERHVHPAHEAIDKLVPSGPVTGSSINTRGHARESDNP